MKTLLKFGVALIMFGVLLSALGVGIIRTHAVKPVPVTASTPVSASVSATTTAPTSVSATTAPITSANAVASLPAKP